MKKINRKKLRIMFLVLSLFTISFAELGFEEVVAKEACIVDITKNDTIAEIEEYETIDKIIVKEKSVIVLDKKEIEENAVEEPIVEPVELTIEEKIKNSCEYYGVQFELALAIARLETGWFSSDAYLYGNNVGGLTASYGVMSFDSLDEGVDAFVGNLFNNYINLGLITVEDIGKKYCPPNYLNWVDLVNELITYDTGL